MQSKSLFALLTALAVTSASPLRRRCSNSTIPTTTNPVNSTSAAVTPTLPTTGSGTQLDGPGSATLKHILVGHGIQNYTCSAAGATATSIGALAVLWDIAALYPGASSSSLSADAFQQLTSTVLRTTQIPLNMAAAAADGTSTGAVVASPFPAPVDLVIDGVASAVQFMGHHFFDDEGTPTIDLSGAGDGEYFKGKKDANVSAPSDADAGVDPATGAVDWLRLSDKGTSVGISLVYRVLTAGGDPDVCTEAGQAMSVPYSAQYWVYGN
ncbi:uncharacterized protein F4807DRAFT_390312 [Annulohypoxylon truncatum]|uniref:uncharacterized protein n=1 Tax=Annulohypoxylon truncatum TaxID=327061 RepID=UPI002008C613|nr:uncharacterized protein F4807DRAFT_390312 [Annulohypoxylon truncatum]KAI1211471.1 hypothetical protein F4807DRAFT_390312 [Annulohypoxylon truncatum]